MNIFNKLEKFVTSGRIDVRSEVISKYLEMKGDKTALKEWCKKEREKYSFEEEEYLREEYSSIIELLS